MNTSVFSDINWLGVAVATLVYFTLGALWYSGILFGKKWAELAGLVRDPSNKEGLGKMMLGSFVLIAITSIALAILVARLDLNLVISGIKLGLLTGLCFATTAVAISFIYESRPLGLYFIDCGYHLVGHIAAAVVLVLI